MSELTRSDIKEIMEILEKSKFTELRIETGDLKIELRRAGATGSVVFPQESRNTSKPVATETAQPAAPAASPAAAPQSGTGTAIPAPMLGIFYHAPKPGDPPFVKIGDVVTPETVIGIIEVMKLMNRVSAGISGVITEIVAPTGELVEYGDPLIRVKVA